MPEHVKCNICSSNTAKLLFVGKDWRYGFPGRFPVVKCQKCGLVYTNPRPTKEEILDYYPDNYDAYKAYNNIPQKYYTQLLRGLQKSNALEIGIGSDEFLKYLSNSGWNTLGVDISYVAVKNAKAVGLKALCGEVQAIHFPEKYFDLVVMRHTLEHVHDPKNTINEIRRILKDDGVLLIEVPDVQTNGIATKLKMYWVEFDLPRHLFHFTPRTLRLLLNESGFKIIKFKGKGLHLLRLLKMIPPFKSWHGRVILTSLGIILKPLELILGELGRGANLHVLAKKQFVKESVLL